MMNKIFKYMCGCVALCGMAAAMGSCSDDNDPTYLDELKVSSSYVAIPQDGGTATITLNATGGSDPISSPITFTGSGEERGTGSFFESADGQELNTEYQIFTAHFVPQGVTKLVLTSVYDVYDKNPSEGYEGNLIRQGCVTTNAIEISELFPTETEARRGRRYTINLTIRPTYLYVLSEPDLDNPTVVVN